MSDTLVILGGVVFQAFEIPEKINFGGKQTLAVHKLIGGQRIIDAMGADPAPISWSGKFRGGAALGRAQSIDAMRITGLPVSLSWLGLTYSVVISEFKAETEKYYEVPYTVTCEVVTDPNQLAASPISSLTALVTGDLSAALAFPEAAALAPVAALSALVSAQPTLNGAPASVTTPLIAAVGTAQDAISSAEAVSDAVLSSCPPTGCAGVVAGQGTALSNAAALQASINACASESDLQNAYALVTRIGVNLTTGAI